MELIIFIISMSALIYGAEILINSSQKIAKYYNISPFILGSTLIALGTSLPEMAISMSASYKNSSQIAVSNVIGSTIFNISLVLGIVFLISKNIYIKRDLFAKDSAWVIFPIIIFIIMSLDSKLNYIDGILLIITMIAYILYLINSNQIDKNIGPIEETLLNKEKLNKLLQISLIIIGFLLTIIGSHYTISSATIIASSIGVSNWIIGLFLVAFGTSLPELVISIKAALKNQIDLAIGNIIGSNVANFCIVLGASSLVNTLNIDLNRYFFDISCAFILCIMLIFIMANKIYNKSSGILLLIILTLVIQNSI
jgi:cation:H+ antiporter